MLELWFDFSCPYAYLASYRAVELARAAGVELAWKPMLLGGVFRGTGAGAGPMATLGHAKAAHNIADMKRWAERWNVPFKIPAAHPMRTVRALRVLCALPHSRWPDAIAALYAAYWQRVADITRDDVIATALAGAGIAEAEIRDALARADSDEIKDELRRRTDEAIALGIFGAPAWVIRRDGHAPVLIWGQDREPWVAAALAGVELDGPASGGPALRPATPTRSPAPTPRRLDLFFDVASPYAYLGLTQVPALVAETGATLRLRPILLGGLFRDIGQVDVPLFAMPKAKREYVALDLARWARWWGVRLDWPRKFPQRTITAQRLCIVAREAGTDVALGLATALGRAMWSEQRDLEEVATLRAITVDAGGPAEWVDRTSEPAIKAALIAETAAAKATGAFGVPSWVVADGDVLWGQDRLDLVADALVRS